ncbi:MAG: MOSC domain-containing protein [Actinomycetota bacterium]
MRVSALWRYPVKSMIGESVERAHVSARGLSGDRAFALQDVETGLVASAKNPKRWPAMFTLRATYEHESPGDQGLGAATIALPDGSRIATDNDDAASVLSKLLGRSVRILTSAPSGASAERYDPSIDGFPVAVPDSVDQFALAGRAPEGTFFDLAPIHVLTTSSLRAFSAAEPGASIDPRRFRPNIVIDSDGDTFVENDWVGGVIRIGDVRMNVTRAAGRCVMVTLPQGDLPRDPAVLRATVANSVYRDPGFPAVPCAGVYADAIGEGEIAVGDSVVVE